MRHRTQKITPIFALCLCAALLLSVLLNSTAAAQEDAPIVVNVSDNIKLSDVKDFGMNIGGVDQFGAAMILKNIVPNPGFEGADMGMIFIVQDEAELVLPETNVWRVQADWTIGWDPAVTGHPDGHWLQGNYEVVSGDGIWQRGEVTWFANEESRYTFYLQGLVAPVKPGDAITVRKPLNGYNADVQPFNEAQLFDIRPGSPGVQSLRLQPASAFSSSWQMGFDTYGSPAEGYPQTGDASAGKLFLVDGEWQFAVWAKATFPGDKLRVRFRRINETIFLEESFPLSTEWQLIQRNFTVPEGADVLGGPGRGIQLELFVEGNNDLFVDDMLLQRANQYNPTEFTDKYVNYLRDLQPGILRNWGGERGQLGSTLANQLAIPQGRRATEYRPEHKVARGFHYSLHDFLILCELVGAEPWYVIPPTFTREELLDLTAYLTAAPGSHPYADLRASLGHPVPWSDTFKTIHLEIGNEIWGSNGGGDPFIGASVRGGDRAGQFGSSRMGVIKENEFYYEPKFNFVIGGQAFVPNRQKEIIDASVNHTSIGLAPYYGELESFATDEERFVPLYGQHGWLMRDSHVTASNQFLKADNTAMAIYELNLHANRHPGIDLETRNAFLTGQGGAISLPLLMMHYQYDLGVRDLLGFQALQFSTYSKGTGGEYVRIMGMLRDLEATGRKRPTWLALEAANKAIGGDMLVTSVENAQYANYAAPMNNGLPRKEMDADYSQEAVWYPDLQAFSYREGEAYRVVLYNLNLTDAQQVTVNLPREAGDATVWELSAPSLYTNNEDANNVYLRTYTINGATVTVPAHSMMVLEWQ